MVTTAVAGACDSIVWVVILRAFMGVAAAAIMPTTLAVILRTFQATHRAWRDALVKHGVEETRAPAGR